MVRRVLPPTDAAKGVKVEHGAVVLEEPEKAVEPPKSAATGNRAQGGVKTPQRPAEPRAEAAEAAPPPPAPAKEVPPAPPAPAASTAMDEVDEQEWLTLLNAASGALSKALQAANNKQAAWERTVARARRAGVNEHLITYAAARVRIVAPEFEDEPER